MENLFPAAKDEGVADRLTSLKKLFALSDEDLHYKWEAFAMAQGEEPDMKESMDEFQRHLQTEAERPRKKAKTNTPLHSRNRVLSTPSRQIKTPNKPITPTPTHINTSGMLPPSSDVPSSPVQHYQARTDSGKVISTFNEDVAPVKNLASAPATYTSNTDASAYQFRTAYQTAKEASQVLDQQIEDMLDLIAKDYELAPEDFANPSVISQEEVAIVGRIAHEDAGYEQRLDSKSLLIETCRRIGGGTSCRLVVDKLPAYSLFPGQILGFIGNNPSGTDFVVKEVLPPPSLPLAMVPEARKAELEEKRGEHPVRIMVAAGPFTTQDNLDYAPLSDLVAAAEKAKPSSIILIGPFLDMDNAKIWSGDIGEDGGGEDTLDAVFESRVVPLLVQLGQSIPIILVPSLRDATNPHNEFPQPPLPKNVGKLPKNFKYVPNPATFSIDEIVVTATSVDAVQDLLSTSVTVKEPDAPPAHSLALRNLLNQRRLYPLFPAYCAEANKPPTQETIHNISLVPRRRQTVSLDVPHLPLADMSLAPNILLLPSLSRPSVEVVNSVMCINPGFLVKRSTGGSYAMITVTSSKEEFWSRTRVDIINI